MTQCSSNRRNRISGVSKMFAGLVLAATSLATLSPVWGQYAGGSRWSSANPPTPVTVDQASITVDDQLRRLPPVDEVSTPAPSPAPVFNDTASQTPAATQPAAEVAAIPQKSTDDPSLAAPVDWSNPSVVIGPEGRLVSHEEVVVAPAGRGSRYSSEPVAESPMTASPSGSRFSEAPVMAPVTQEVESSTASNNSVYARVFDENDESNEQPVLPEAAEQTSEGNTPETQQPVGEAPADEPAADKSDLSPIFACRLLGLPSTQGKDDAETATQR